EPFLRRLGFLVFLFVLALVIAASACRSGQPRRAALDRCNRRDRHGRVRDVLLVARRTARAPGAAGRRAHFLDAFLRLRVRREQAVALRLVLVAIVEPRQEIGERAGGVAGLLRISYRRLVGIELVAAIELVLEHDLVRLAGDLVQQRAAIRRRRFRAELNGAALPDGVHGLLVRAVADFVREHARKLRLGGNQLERAAGDVDDAARGGEGSHAASVENDESPRDTRPHLGAGHAQTYEGDVLLHGWF